MVSELAPDAKGLLVIVGGPAGCGKTTVGHELAERLDASFVEGDSLHPQENIRKMAEGIPLTDEDRWGWLENLAELSSYRASKSHSHMCIASCSALKLKYRDLIRSKSLPITVATVFIPCDEDVLLSRVEHRKGHYMKADMVKSQLKDMEVPKPDEPNCFVYHNTVDLDDCQKHIEKLLAEVLA